MDRTTCSQVWNKCLQFIKTKINEQSFRTWFIPIIPRSLENNVLTVEVPSQFFYEWLEANYITLLSTVLNRELGAQGKLAYVIEMQNHKKNQAIKLNATAHSPIAHNQQSPSNQLAIKSPFVLYNIDKTARSSYLNPSYHFVSFIEGSCNQLAKSAAKAVSKNPGKTSFNPLMIYGGVGLGKTHLVQAIGNAVKEVFVDSFVLYVSSEKFTSQFIASLKDNNVQNFINFYLQVDVLIVDDIQFLVGKSKTQEIFFHIFNHLHQNGKQLVMTSDSPPRSLEGLQDRLLSRFKWGLTTDLLQPDFETKMAIIYSKIEQDGIHIADDIIQYIAASINTNIRELEGVLISLIAHASLNKQVLNLALAKQVLGHIVDNVDVETTVDYIQKMIAVHYQTTIEALQSKSRKKAIVIARQMAIYLAKAYTNYSLKQLGIFFGNRDHSTIMYAIQSVTDRLTNDQQFKEEYEQLKTKITLQSSG